MEPAAGSPRLLSLSSRLTRLKCWGTAKRGVFFSPSQKTPFRGENAPVKFYFPLQNHLPRSQELRAGEIKYPIILQGTEGRGGEGGTLTKPSPRSPVLCTECLEPGEACEACGDVSPRLRAAPSACPRPSRVHAARAAEPTTATSAAILRLFRLPPSCRRNLVGQGKFQASILSRDVLSPTGATPGSPFSPRLRCSHLPTPLHLGRPAPRDGSQKFRDLRHR